MSATTKENVKLIAPELVTFIDANEGTVTLILSDVAGEVTQGVFGSKQEKAQRYLAAHYLTFANSSSGAGAGPVKKEKVGDVEKEYAVSAVSSAKPGFSETSYGRTFLQIRSGCIVGFQQHTP